MSQNVGGGSLCATDFLHILTTSNLLLVADISDSSNVCPDQRV